MSADDIVERLYQKLSASRRRPFAPSMDEDKAGDSLWDLYLDSVEDEDKARAESWNGSTAGILTFTGLFATTVGAFVIESYKMLQPDPSAQTELIGNQTLVLLAQLVAGNSITPNVTIPDVQTSQFEAPYSAVVVNSLWFLSFVISLACVLLATLIQEWTRDFVRDIHRRTTGMTIKTYALNHIFVRTGVERFKLDYVTSLIVALMHLAVILFLVGLTIFLHPINRTTAMIVETSGIIAASVYVYFSLIPFWVNSCPYRTPLTYVFVATVVVVASTFWVVFCFFIAVWGIIVAVKDKTWWWKTLSAKRLGSFQAAVRFYFYTWLPSRRLPGHKEFPIHVPKKGQELYLRDKDLLLLWEHASKYLFEPEGKKIFLEHLPHQLLDFDVYGYKAFFVSFRHSSASMGYFMKMMSSIESLEAGLGLLTLLKSLLGADHGVGTMIEPDRARRWDKMHDLPYVFPIFCRKIISFGTSTEAAIKVLLGLSEFRGALIQIRLELLPKMSEEDWDTNVQLLNNMLRFFETIDGFGLIALYSDSENITARNVDELGRDIIWGYELAVRNALTLVANLIYLDQEDTCDKGHVKKIMTSWRKLNTGQTAYYKLVTGPQQLRNFFETSRRRSVSSQLLSLFLSQTHAYGYLVGQFSTLFTIPSPGDDPELGLAEAAEQTLRSYRGLFEPFSASPQSPFSSDTPDATKHIHSTRQEPEDVEVLDTMDARTNSLDDVDVDGGSAHTNQSVQRACLSPEPQSGESNEVHRFTPEASLIRAILLKDDDKSSRSSVISPDENSASTSSRLKTSPRGMINNDPTRTGSFISHTSVKPIPGLQAFMSTEQDPFDSSEAMSLRESNLIPEEGVLDVASSRENRRSGFREEEDMPVYQ